MKTNSNNMEVDHYEIQSSANANSDVGAIDIDMDFANMIVQPEEPIHNDGEQAIAYNIK